MATDLLSLVYQYRSLLGRRDVLGQRLSEEHERRLQALEMLFGWSSGERRDERRRMARCPVAIPALVEASGKMGVTTIVDISGEGLSLDRAPAAQPGDHIVVLVQDLHAGLEYRMPADVCWRRDEVSALGARFVDLPVLIRHRRWALADGASV